MKKIRYYKFIKLEKIAMNYKLEKFWNSNTGSVVVHNDGMNYKLEKFWNETIKSCFSKSKKMNYKLEKFWNVASSLALLFP